jgi:predicted nucleic acid-binding protein
VTIFTDSSVWFAIANIKDRHRSRAKVIMRQETKRLTTDPVVVETWQLINSRIDRNAAEAFWRGIRRGGTKVETVEASNRDRARATGETFPGRSFSIVDRTGFAAMERLGLVRAASFDDDSVVYRFGRRKDRAFKVVR